MELLIALLVIVGAALTAQAAWSRLVVTTVVLDYQRGVRFERGRLAGLVEPGTHLALRGRTEIRVLDLRPGFTTIEGQEILTADGIAAKVSLVAYTSIGDPVTATVKDIAYGRTLYVRLQQGLRDAISRRTFEQALADRAAMGPEICEALVAPLAAVGVDLHEVQVRDVMVPAELKRAYAAVLVARREGEAALERTRSETAALRSLANAGRLVEDNPGLLHLRLLQELGASSGNTIVFGAPEVVGTARAARPRPARAAGGKGDPATVGDA